MPPTPLRILHVEDRADDVRLFRKMLERADGGQHRITHASTLREALSLLSPDAFDVVALDLYLDDAGGLDTVRGIVEPYPSLPVVVLTGCDDEDFALRVVQCGAQDCLIKQHINGQVIVRVLRYAIERKKADRALRADKERIEMVIEAGGVGLWDWDIERDVLRWDPRGLPIFHADWPRRGNNLDGFLGLLHPQDVPRVRAQIATAAESAVRYDTEYRILWPDGTVRYIAAKGRVLRRPDGRARRMLGVCFDVTKSRQADEALKERERELQRAYESLRRTLEERDRMEDELRLSQKLEAVGQLASGIAHEINTPIQFVGDSVHFLCDAWRDLDRLVGTYEELLEALRGTAAPEELFERIAAARESADLDYLRENAPPAFERALEGIARVSVIVRSVKTFAHPDQKDKVAADLNEALRNTLTICVNEYKYVAHVRTEFGDLPPVPCYLGEINQVFLNLIVNAAHAIADKGAPEPERNEIVIRTRADGDFVEVSISDTGVGIPEAVRAKIYDPFFTTKTVGRGTGQGLAIARRVVVEKHGGCLSFETEMGRGTTFVVRLPIARAEGAGREAA